VNCKIVTEDSLWQANSAAEPQPFARTTRQKKAMENNNMYDD